MTDDRRMKVPTGGRVLAAVAVVAAGTWMCANQFDTRRQVDPRGTVGAETFRILCARVDVGESPDDLDFARARPACVGAAPPESIPMLGDRVRALTTRRLAVIDALDRTIPVSLYPQMDPFLWRLLPLYGGDGVTPLGGTIAVPDAGSGTAEDLLPQTTRALTRLLRGMAENRAALDALERMSARQGMRRPRAAIGLARALLGYPQLGDVLDAMMALIGDDAPGRPAGAGHANWHNALDVFRGELAGAAPSSDPRAGTTLDATIDLVLRSDPALSTGRARWMTRRDSVGMPRVAPVGGALPTPFVDVSPRDGFADSARGVFVDAAMHPLDPRPDAPFPTSEGAPASTPRDPEGRAMRDGTALYDYVDLDQTVLAALLRDARTLVDPGPSTALRFAHGASALMGVHHNGSHDYMHDGPLETATPEVRCTQSAFQPPADCLGHAPAASFGSYDTSTNAPLVDFVHAAGSTLAAPTIDPILNTFEQLFATQEPLLARSVAAMLAIDRSADMNASATISPQSNVWDDVIDVARRIALVPGLLEDVVAALGDRNGDRLGAIFATWARTRDRVEPRWTAADQNNPPIPAVLTTRVDWNAADTSDFVRDGADRTVAGPADNRSLFQRFLHVVHDLNGVPICNREGAYIRVNSLVRWPLIGTYRACELLRIDDAAIAYLQAIAGVVRLDLRDGGIASWLAGVFPGTIDSLLESSSGIRGFDRTPTPEAINRFVFQPDSMRTDFTRALADPVRTRDGLDVRTVHAATLFAAELDNFYAAFRPLAEAFVRHGDASAHLLVELLSAVHLHYATERAGWYQNRDPAMARYSALDGARRFEPILADALAGDLLPSASSLVRTLPSINAGGGRTGLDALVLLARALLDPAAIPNLAYRDGRRTTVRSDGRTPVSPPSLYYLFADAFNAIDASFASAPAERDSWEQARSAMVDLFLGVDDGGTASARFHNRHIPTISRMLIQWLRARVSAHRSAGDFDAWARGLGNRLAEVIAGPTFGTSVTLLLDFYHDGATRAAIGQLLQYLLDESGDGADNTFGLTLTGLGDLLQLMRADSDIDPFLHALAPAFQRRVGATDGMGFLREELVPTVLRFVDRARGYDSDHVLDQLLPNMVSRPDNPPVADEPIVVLGDAIAETHRVAAGAGGPLGADDFDRVLRQVAEFFGDGSRGMEQFYFIVQHRRVPMN